MTVQAEVPVLSWDTEEASFTLPWRSATGAPVPKRAQAADDRMPADTAYRLCSEGCALIWQGDFQNARMLLQAVARRVDQYKPSKKQKAKAETATPAEIFNRYRQLQAQRARTLGLIVIRLEGDYTIDLRRAPDVALACAHAYGEPDGQASLVSLRELQGVIGAYEWHRKGLDILALGARIHPAFGVFAPVRGEYVELVSRAELPSKAALAFDIGTGTGVLAALLHHRGVAKVIATDVDPRALACAAENIRALGMEAAVDVVRADLFPPGQADLIVCNPPWLPGRPGNALDHAIYDPDSQMLKGFLNGLPQHLNAGGEGWLVLSDLAEHLGLRQRDDLKSWIEQAGLVVAGREQVRPTHNKVADASDPLHAARAKEVTSIWRLKHKAA